MKASDIEKYLKEHLSEFRYDHSSRVAEEAQKIAKVYHIDEEKSYLVGLAHDVAHEYTEEENLFLIKKYNLPKKYLDKSYKNILHSDIGALVAKDYFSFDEEMCQAIKYHTIGNVNMDLFAKIIFIADKVGRKNLDIKMEQVKKTVYDGNIDKALISYFDILKDSLKSRNLPMHEDSLELIKLLKRNIDKLGD